MNPLDALTAAAAALLTFAAAPLSSVRRAALTLIVMLARLALPTAVAACGLFAVMPDLVPTELVVTAGQVAEVAQLPLPPAQPVLLWLGLAGLTLVVGLPVLAHLEYARRAALLTSLLTALHRDAAAAVAAIERADDPTPAHRPSGSPATAGDVAGGVAVLRAILNDPARRPTRIRPPLIKDYLLETRN